MADKELLYQYSYNIDSDGNMLIWVHNPRNIHDDRLLCEIASCNNLSDKRCWEIVFEEAKVFEADNKHYFD